MENKIDRRVTKTQKSIKKAFIELMDKIGFDRINVQKIIEQAEINRSTFYLHYNDKFDLLNQIEDEFLRGYKSIVKEANIKHVFSDDSRLMDINHVASYIYENKEIISLLTSDKGDPKFLSKIGGMIDSVYKDMNLVIISTIPQRYVFALISGIITNLIGEWIRSGFNETSEQFSQIVFQLTKDMNKNFFDNFS